MQPFWTEANLVYMNSNLWLRCVAPYETRFALGKVTGLLIAVPIYEYPRESLARVRGSRQMRTS